MPCTYLLVFLPQEFSCRITRWGFVKTPIRFIRCRLVKIDNHWQKSRKKHYSTQKTVQTIFPVISQRLFDCVLPQEFSCRITRRGFVKTPIRFIRCRLVKIDNHRQKSRKKLQHSIRSAGCTGRQCFQCSRGFV